MPHVERPGGLRLTFPSTYELVDAPGSGVTRGGVRSGARGMDRFRPRALPVEASDDPVVAALAPHGLEVASETELRAAPAGRTRGARGDADGIALSIPVSPEEEAVVLTEQDGVYAWSFPEPAPAEETQPTRRSRGLGGLGPRVRTFRVSLPEGPAEAPGTRTRGFVGDIVIGRVRTFVLKFAARAATHRIVDHVERDVRTGAFLMGAEDPDDWRPLAGGLALPSDRPARLLLLVHGTFSSSLGAYGALGASPWGRELLGHACHVYDAILGWDHRTLGVDPRRNAEELMEFLRALDLPFAPRIDVITHSRGGLVFRSLAEYVLPSVAESVRPRIDRAVFVGVPNAGTTLADPERWRDCIDVYTNIAVGACRFIGRLPQAKVATVILSELIQGLGGLVKALAQQALESGDVPGLSAMRPGGDFLRDLNGTQPGQPKPDATFYCAITSGFKASLGDPHAPPELPRRLLMGLVDRVADRVLGEANDLIVNTSSMTAIDGGGRWIKDRLHFEATPHIYHTNYFARPEVVGALERWLELGPATVVATDEGARLPAGIDTDIVVIPADATVGELRTLLAEDDASYVVVRRLHEGRTLRYAWRRDEVEQRTAGSGADASVHEALSLREFDASAERAPAEVSRPLAPAGEGGPTAGRAVVMDRGLPVGVQTPADDAAPSAEELVAVASREVAPEATGGASGPVVTSPQPTRRTRSFRSRGGAGGTATAPPPPAPAPSLEPESPPEPVDRQPSLEELVQAHFQAEMPDTVSVGDTATIILTLSRDVIASAAEDMFARASAQIEASRKLRVLVRPRRNFEVVGPARAEIDPPRPGEPIDLYFDVRATHEGPGEVWIVIRQEGPHDLATLRLQPAIVAEAPPVTRATRAAARAPTAAPAPRPLCQLRIFERDNGPEISHEYELHIPGKVLEVFASAPMRVDRAAYVARLYEQIEERWLSSDRDLDDFTEELRALGGNLFENLFPSDLQAALWKHRAELNSIQVISTEPFIPWELVHLKEPGQPLPDESMFFAELGLVRWLHGTWFPDRMRVRKGRVRYVVPDYPHPDDKLPEAQKELRFLTKTFAAEPVEPQPRAVRELLRGPGAFDLLHFACHGVADSTDIGHAALLLQGRVENGHVIPASIDVTTVRETSRLEQGDGNRPMVVLNACQVGRLGFSLTRVGGFAEAFLRRGAGAFVGSLWSVGDLSARVFTEELYRGLMKGDTLGVASAAARRAAAKEGDASWLAYAVYGHPDLQVRFD